MTIQKLAGPARVASIVLLGVAIWGCAPDAVSPDPELTAVFAKPGGGGNPSNTVYPVTATISNTSQGSPLRVQSDGLGPYTNTTQISSVIAQNMRGSTWDLTTYYGRNYTPSNRKVFFSLTEKVSPSDPEPPFSEATLPAHLIVKCWEVDKNMITMALEESVECPGTLRFKAPNNKWYRLSYDNSNYPVDQFKLTCTATDATGCKSWSIVTAGTTVTGSDPNLKGKQRLLEIDPGSTAVIAELGYFYISLGFSVSR